MTENYAIDPTEQRRKRGQGLQKETLSPSHAPLVARYKARAPFTLLDMRQQIMEEAKDKPAAKRERSLRRRLTPFDRALSEAQAEILDRLVRASLAIAAKLRGASWTQSVDGTREQRLPFTDREHSNLALLGRINSRLAPRHKAILRDLCARMMPDHEPLSPVDYAWIAAAKEMADAVLSQISSKNGK
jgi:hypothetical protein